MARFLRVEFVIDEETSIFLSQDGTSGATRCQIEIPEYEDLLSGTTGVLFSSASGGFVEQLAPWTKKQFEIKILTWIGAAVWEEIRSLRNTNFDCRITEYKESVWTETFNQTVRTVPDKAFSAQNPRNGRIHTPSIRLYTV